ncbi:hypothetical protein Zm00014a_029434 [Zea mays]|uniref:Uncharacterized protein n=1 Tax=Zea mays TaxID=4577 RepID=A0A3L6G013_MAIZE|nr:hypothetical protein Zm00014a_029434 [Zea mays]
MGRAAGGGAEEAPSCRDEGERSNSHGVATCELWRGRSSSRAGGALAWRKHGDGVTTQERAGSDEATAWASCRDAGERSKDEAGTGVQEQRLVELSAVEEQRAPWLGETPWGSSARGFGGLVWYHGRRRAGEAD